jgi:hypothetical protein
LATGEWAGTGLRDPVEAIIGGYVDKVVQKLVALGIPGLVLLGIIATTELAGAAAIVAALSVLGGPLGILGGIAVLGVLALAADAVAEFGFESVATRVVAGLVKNGSSKRDIKAKINSYSLLSKGIKKRIIATLDGESTK